jgi:hypothetical protein
MHVLNFVGLFFVYKKIILASKHVDETVSFHQTHRQTAIFKKFAEFQSWQHGNEAICTHEKPFES